MMSKTKRFHVDGTHQQLAHLHNPFHMKTISIDSECSKRSLQFSDSGLQFWFDLFQDPDWVKVFKIRQGYEKRMNHGVLIIFRSERHSKGLSNSISTNWTKDVNRSLGGRSESTGHLFRSLIHPLELSDFEEIIFDNDKNSKQCEKCQWKNWVAILMRTSLK